MITYKNMIVTLAIIAVILAMAVHAYARPFNQNHRLTQEVSDQYDVAHRELQKQTVIIALAVKAKIFSKEEWKIIEAYIKACHNFEAAKSNWEKKYGYHLGYDDAFNK